jgi:hypothetical protein
MPDRLAGARRWIASTSVAPANGATRFVIDRDGLRDEVISELPRIYRVVAGTHGGAARTARQRSRVRPSAATATCSSNSQTTDADFGIRTDTAWRLWRPVTGRRHGRPPDRLTRQRRYRLGLALRALDARLAGVLSRHCGGTVQRRIHSGGRGWKTHDLRDRTIRLVRSGTELMQGGYLNLLRE